MLHTSPVTYCFVFLYAVLLFCSDTEVLFESNESQILNVSLVNVDFEEFTVIVTLATDDMLAGK